MPRVVTSPPSDAPVAGGGIRAGGWWHESEDGKRLICDLCPAALRPAAGRAGVLLRPRKPRRAGRLDHLRPQHRLLHRPDREEAAQPVLSRHAGALVRHARLQPGLHVLPELDHVAEPRRRGRLRRGRSRRPSPRPPKAHGCRSVAFTYNDPIIWAEYAIDTARACHAAGRQDRGRHLRLHHRRRPRRRSTNRWTPPTSI